jgi:hypothetical protein
MQELNTLKISDKITEYKKEMLDDIKNIGKKIR